MTGMLGLRSNDKNFRSTEHDVNHVRSTELRTVSGVLEVQNSDNCEKCGPVTRMLGVQNSDKNVGSAEQ